MNMPSHTNYLHTMDNLPEATIDGDRAWDMMLWALCDGFPYLTYPQIKTPPKGWFEAALARQIGVWLMVNKLGVSKNQTLKLAGVTKEMTSRTFKKIESRMQEPKFKEHVERVLALAVFKIREAHERQKENNN